VEEVEPVDTLDDPTDSILQEHCEQEEPQLRKRLKKKKKKKKKKRLKKKKKCKLIGEAESPLASKAIKMLEQWE
jgi:hypothetical protein